MNNSISGYGHHAFGRHEGNVPSITNFSIEYLLLQDLGVRINTLSDICVFDTTKTREIPIKVWKLQ